MTITSIEAQQRTRAFARVIGPYVAVFTTVLAIRLPDLGKLVGNLFDQPSMVWMLGASMLGGGLIIIGVHRNWRGPLAITVSLFGWFVAIRGFLLIAVPSTVQSSADATLQSPTATLLFRLFFGTLAVAGLVLTYAGWFSRADRCRVGVASRR
ncbi:hypothetical protein [Plantactinospora sp. B5E13]|uniref:hypothetical protein n=1 Tax=unclassified Plantactinospora TaxID=2631981 RepID=UPI00325E5286